MSAATLLDLGVAELAAHIRDGSLTSRAATEATLGALERDGPGLNAVARLWRDRALAAAETADRERAAGKIRGPIHGVPLPHKDMYHRAGELSEMGTTIFRGHRPRVTATALKKLDAAGALDIGRLNMVEFALGITGHNHHTGTPRNAWGRDRVTGGSTSGGATVVAARLAFATLGSDTGGSIRIPASLCGIVGIKPTYGRVSRHGAMPLACSLDTIGPLARSARDCAILLGAIAGPDPGDRTTSPRPVPDYTAGIERGVTGLRIAVPRDCFDVEVEPSIAALADGATKVLAGLGARVEERRLAGMAPLNVLRRVLMLGEAPAVHRDLLRTRMADYNPETTVRMMAGFALRAVDYVTALAARGHLLERFCREAFADADVLALPSSPIPTPTIAETATGGDARFGQLANLMGALVGPFNYLGLPALSVPMGLDPNGMPAGLQLVARPFAEALLLRVAHAFEAASGWSARKPPTA